MIDVEAALQAVPHFDRFCSVDKLYELVDEIGRDRGAGSVIVAGRSRDGLPIHQVTFCGGRTKALVVGGPHAMEPIGSLTVYALLTLLKQRHPSLLDADVEWHVIPCIDPDGAKLNEGWTQQDFSLERYMRHRYMQATQDQVDTSFPYSYKRLAYSAPSAEAEVLRTIIDRTRPDFYFPLHNNCLGGAFFFLSRDLGESTYQTIRHLLDRLDYPMHPRPPYREVTGEYAPGFMPLLTLGKFYDYLEATTSYPERSLQRGGASWDYLEQTRPSTLVFVAELGHVQHPDSESDESTGQNLRQFKMHLDAEMKSLAALMLEKWQRTKDLVDQGSPLYRAVFGGMTFPTHDQIVEGGSPLARYPTRDVLFNPRFNKEMSRGERFDACMEDGGFLFLRTTYQFVRMLQQSPASPEVTDAAHILDKAFKEAFELVINSVESNRFKTFELATLVRAQFGSCLIALNSLLSSLTFARQDALQLPKS